MTPILECKKTFKFSYDKKSNVFIVYDNAPHGGLKHYTPFKFFSEFTVTMQPDMDKETFLLLMDLLLNSPLTKEEEREYELTEYKEKEEIKRFVDNLRLEKERRSRQ